jgi:FlaA1/EpsC-like NDP-sugar epimerase
MTGRFPGRETWRRWLHHAAPGDRAETTLAAALDLLVVGAAYTAAYLLRFDGSVPERNIDFALIVVPVIAVLHVVANGIFGVYRTVWAYGSVADVVMLFRPVALVTLLVFGTNIWVQDRDLPLSVILIGGLLTFAGMVSVKLRGRLLSRRRWAPTSARRLLIVGAGHTGQSLARTIENSPGLNYQPVGFLDDDDRKHHRRMHGIRVLGPVSSLERAIRDHEADAVAIAVPNAPGAVVREIVAVCQRAAVPVRIVPGVEDWVSGGARGGDALREITLDDLLGREPVAIDAASCAQSVRDRVVLVTGAAGSIGSELCRQVLAFQPRELHLLDNNESGLHDLSLELAGVSPDTTVRLWVTNIVDREKVDLVFDRTRPDLVYHAAALKHVPLMEEQPDEAFSVNVLGTLHVARAARTYGAARFVLISTDKAVRPTSVMGATKRIAELLILGLSRESDVTRFSAVRFGNVMGSRGSVVPTFMRQIDRGGPVTVMHPEMMRYFISIPEAVSLVIQAGTFAGQGKIYMLDMGEEINILELAERMIRLRGLQPGRDIQVVFTGPRPGEKLREELVADFERLEPTPHPKVMRLTADVEVTEAEVVRLIDEIARVPRGDVAEFRRRIHLVAHRFSIDGGGVERTDAGSAVPQ